MTRFLPASPRARRAFLVFAGYIGLSSLLGEFGPFTRYPMYSQAHQAMNSLVLLVDGEPSIMLARYKDFSFDPGCLAPERVGFSNSEIFSAPELRVHIGENQAPKGAPPGPLRVEIRAYEARWDPEARDVRTEERLLCGGTASRR